MGIKILNRYRLSDSSKQIHDVLDVFGRSISVKLLEEVKISDYTSHKGLKKLPKATKNAIVSAILCVENVLTEKEKMNLGVFVGTSLSYVEHGLQFMSEAYSSSPRLVSPLMFPNTVLNSISGWISIILGSRSINTTINTGQNSGIDSLKIASEYLQMGIIDKALVVVTEEITKSIIESDLYSSDCYAEDTFALLLTLSTEDEPKYEIEEIYSKYITEYQFLQYIEKIDKQLSNKEKSVIVGFWEKDIIKKAHYHYMNSSNMLSGSSINYLFEYLGCEKYDNVIICETNRSNMYSYLKVKKGVRNE